MGGNGKGDITDIQTELTHSIERLDSAKRKEFPVSAGRNGVKTAPMRKPPTRPNRAEATPATCDSERALTAVELAMPAEWPMETCAYAPCKSKYAPAMIGYDRSGRLSTVQQAAGMGPATSFQCVRNGRPKRRPPAQTGPRPPRPQSSDTRCANPPNPQLPVPRQRRSAGGRSRGRSRRRWSPGFSRLASEDAG